MARKHLFSFWEGKSCLAFARSEMFGLGIEPKEKISCLFNTVSIGIRLVPGHVVMVAIDIYVRKKPLVRVDIRDYVNAYNFNLHVCF